MCWLRFWVVRGIHFAGMLGFGVWDKGFRRVKGFRILGCLRVSASGERGCRI